MTHVKNTISGPITEVPASGPGALSGFEFRCELCDEVARFSLLGLATAHALDHAAYMAGRGR